MEVNKIICGDCLEVMKGIPDKSIDMILCDLPYGTTACKWDVIIPFEPLWKEYYRVLRPNGFIILTASQPFAAKLLTSNIDNFSHNWVWDKGRGVGHLLANKRPMITTEDILVFSNELKKYDFDNEHPLRDWFYNEYIKSNINPSQYRKILGNDMVTAGHYFTKGVQFTMPTLENYKKLQTTGFFNRDWNELKRKDTAFKKYLIEKLDNKYPRIYNPQMRERSRTRISKNKGVTECYGNTNEFNGVLLEESYPINLISFSKSSHKDMLLHPTQKPVALFEYLIKTYTNEGDLVLDNCAGSGTTGVACKNLKRDYILIEKEEKYCEIARKRLKAIPELLF